MIIARIYSLDAMLGNFQLPSSYLSKQNFWERILRNFINVFNYANKALWDKYVKTFGCIWNSDYIDSRKASTKQSRGYQMCEVWVWSSKSSLLWKDFREVISLLVMISQLGRSWWSVNSNMLNNLMIPFNRLMLCRSSPALPYELETHKKIGSKVEVRSKFIIFPNFGLNRLSNFSFASQTHTSKSTRAFIILNLWRKTAFSSLHICTERVTKLRNSLFACVK